MEKINNYLALLQKQFDNIFYNYRPSVITLYEPIYYALDDGKKLRGVSVLIANEVFDGNLDSALILAYCVEMFHNFTLLHDDVMDNSTLRRGKLSVQAKYGVNQAILSGDAMLILVYNRLLSLPMDIYYPAIELINRSALQVCEGQQLDLEFEKRDRISTDEYNEMIKLKTAVLLAGALSVGAINCKTTKYNIDEMYNLGLNLGMAFQIHDDYFDCFSSTDSFGKKIGNDILTRKKTFLFAKTLEVLPTTQQNEFIKLYNDTNIDAEEKISKVLNIFKENKIDVLALEYANDFYQKALKNIQNLEEISEEKKNILRDFANFVFSRKK